MAKPFRVTLKWDKRKLTASMEAACTKGLAAMGVEALKDANYYAREDTSAMIQSSITASEMPTGTSKRVRLIWNTPYAKKTYYTGVPSTDTNPNASLLWAHKAYAENFRKYEGILRRAAAARRR